MINSKNPHAFAFLKKVTIDYERNSKRINFFFFEEFHSFYYYFLFLKTRKNLDSTIFIRESRIKRNVDRNEIPKVIGFQSWEKKGEGKKGKDDFLPLRRNGLSSIVSSRKDGNVYRGTKWKFIEIECQDF